MLSINLFNVLWVIAMGGTVLFLFMAIVLAYKDRPIKKFVLSAVVCLAAGLVVAGAYIVRSPGIDTEAAFGGDFAETPGSFEEMPLPPSDIVADGAQEELPSEVANSEYVMQEEVLGTTLEGTWLWMGITYYVFESDGTGTMGGLDINWSSRAGVLSICGTPALCMGNCFAPTEWYYSVEGDQLTLISRISSALTYTYTRG